MSRVGVDAHVLTGKHQGSRTWLQHVLASIDRLVPTDDYVVYSEDPVQASAMVGATALDHRQLPHRPAAVRLLATWPRIAVRDDLDVLITQYNAPPLGAGQQVVVVHDVLFETHPHFFPPAMRYRLQAMTRLSVHRAALVVTVSDYSRRQIIDTYRVPPERLVVCPNGVAAPIPASAESEPMASEAKRPYLLMVGRIEPRKNVDLVLQATAAVRSRGMQLVLVGSNDFSAAETVRSIAASENVLHLTGVSDSRLSALYRSATALVFASSGEGFGLPVLEALAHGTPVVASDRTSIPEVGGSFARYFNPDDPDAGEVLSALIEQVANDQSVFGPAALRRHLATFDWQRSAADLVTAVQGLTR